MVYGITASNSHVRIQVIQLIYGICVISNVVEGHILIFLNKAVFLFQIVHFETVDKSLNPCSAVFFIITSLEGYIIGYIEFYGIPRILTKVYKIFDGVSIVKR